MRVDRFSTGFGSCRFVSMLAIVSLWMSISIVTLSLADELRLQLQYQVPVQVDGAAYNTIRREETWSSQQTAIIVCDVWDAHHCLNAVRRVTELTPRLDAVLKHARSQGIVVIHAPSDCMAAYQEHPARKRAQQVPTAANLPPDITSWCSVIPQEERAEYPLDQSDGGEDDDPVEHAAWAKELEAQGRNPKMPWKKQADQIQIDGESDYISDRGDEIWSILEHRGIQNVVLAGVHTNMCVLGRPFGLRQMARNGKRVVLMRDMTDTTYNPARWPFVSHFTGTDLIVSHIERHVCPTITSDQWIGGEAFRFSGDKRPHLVAIVAEDEYETSHTLPLFAKTELGRDFRVSWIFGSAADVYDLPGAEQIDNADMLLISVRRRPLKRELLAKVQAHVQQGKPVVGLRTASHAFSERSGEPKPSGVASWPEFDSLVLGGNYQGHHENGLGGEAVPVAATDSLGILKGISSFPMTGSLYLNSPLRPGTRVWVNGTVPGHASEPVCWTYERKDGGRSFYTSLGHREEFKQSAFVTLLRNGIFWSAGLQVPDTPAHSSTPTRNIGQIAARTAAPKTATKTVTNTATNTATNGLPMSNLWGTIEIPESWGGEPSARAGGGGTQWYRCVVRVPASWSGQHDGLRLSWPPLPVGAKLSAWWNGQPVMSTSGNSQTPWEGKIDAGAVANDEYHWLVVRIQATNGRQAEGNVAPQVLAAKNSRLRIELAGRWQFRNEVSSARLSEGQPDWSQAALPPKFGGSADIVFEPGEELFVARPETMAGSFTAGIEGPVADDRGNVFAVNYERQGTIGRISAGGHGEVFVQLPPGSIGNGIQFDSDGSMLVADYRRHNILRVDGKTRHVSVLAHNGNMHQPNDLARASDGTLYVSDPDWSSGSGQLWKIDTQGKMTRLITNLGTTNGIELSHDEATLYVNESVQRRIWAYAIETDRSLGTKSLVKEFADFSLDGMRCDVEGNLYVSRHGGGKVIKLSPNGQVVREIDTLGAMPSNVCFGGKDGKTVYVTEVEFGRIVRFQVDSPGATWTRLFVAKHNVNN